MFPALIYNCDSKPRQTPFKKLVKSSLGVFSALILTFLIHIYFRYQIKVDPNRVCITLFTFFLLLLVGLTINGRKFRCIVLLALPYMASSRGRAIVLMNCMSLTTTVVAPSILNNLQQLHHFTICNVDMVIILFYIIFFFILLFFVFFLLLVIGYWFCFCYLIRLTT